MEVGFVFSNSIVLHAAGVSEIPEVSCVMHKRLQMIGNKTITRARGGVETSGDKIWCNLGEERKGSNSGLAGKTLQQSGRAFQLLPGLRVSSKPKESRSLVLVVNNKFSGPAPEWRSV